MATASPPRGEVGQALPAEARIPLAGRSALVTWQSFIDDAETVPELRWPRSVLVYDRMRSDPQVDAVFRGCVLPIRRYRWSLDPAGCPDEVVAAFAEDTGLLVDGRPDLERARNQGRFSWDHHLRHVLLALLYGFAYFEQVGEIDATGKWRLRKLAPRMPKTITELSVAEDGGLEWIRQGWGWEAPLIGVERLVCYVNDMEGANWVGRSVFRSAYQPWLIKDQLLRIDVVKHRRTGMGVPTVELPPGATQAQRDAATALAMAYKVGDASGGALPDGMHLRLVGVEGQTSDVLASIRYHDEQIARLALQMFTMLGTTQTGSRALGQSFIDFFAMAQEAVSEWVCAIFNAYVIEDYVDWNWGEDVPAPKLKYQRAEEPELAAQDLASLVDKGLLVVDAELRDYLRSTYGLPEANPATAVPAPAPSAPGPAAGHRHARRLRARQALHPTSGGWRDLTEWEIRAGVDYRALQASFESERLAAVNAWKGVRAAQIEEIAAAAEAAKNLQALAGVSAKVAGADLLEPHIRRAAETGITSALTEAAGQGVVIKPPPVERIATAARADAMAQVLTDALSQAAGARAVRLGDVGSPGLAAELRDYLGGLTDAYLHDQIGGALTAAQNDGRVEVMAEGDPSAIYASELMDEATCDPCSAIDGTEYASLDEAMSDYPAGGYIDCDGGPRCRGTLVAVYGEQDGG